ncbi:MAG: hypothetical protein GY913_08660 [Proteobacteria bacterium]|nr:hypothetical protein [Pseudomonadota bacterium]MCP4916982.1 hypothetical protein [Pseudomonadota bacterium]
MSFKGNWGLNLAEIGALRLQHARRAFEDRDPQLALIEAEELLEDEPDNSDALLLVADAALELGQPEISRSAFLHAIDQGPQPAWVLSGYAVACYELSDIDACLLACDQALALQPDLAEAWYYRALALDFQGRGAEAAEAFGAASSHDGKHFPPTTPLSTAEVTHILESAVQALDPKLADWYAQCRFEVHRYPRLDDLRQSELPLSPSSVALYQGKPAEADQDPWQVFPDRIELYVANLEHAGALGAAPASLLATTLRSEALDWLLLSDDELPLRT